MVELPEHVAVPEVGTRTLLACALKVELPGQVNMAEAVFFPTQLIVDNPTALNTAETTRLTAKGSDDPLLVRTELTFFAPPAVIDELPGNVATPSVGMVVT